jgi:hypothetical protein
MIKKKLTSRQLYMKEYLMKYRLCHSQTSYNKEYYHKNVKRSYYYQLARKKSIDKRKKELAKSDVIVSFD